MTSKRQAPKQKVLEIHRAGPWGDVKYEHKLECGHSEVLARASKATRIACSWCVKANSKDIELRTLAPQAKTLWQVFTEDDETNSNEIELSKIKASLASVLNIPLEAIEIIATDKQGVLEIKSAYIFLSARDVQRLINRGGQQ